MIKLAGQGKHVVRLKSGDPMIFGRAGEEIAALERHGIAVEVVPGVTAAFAMAARLGVSLTHRDHANSVRFVTGHARSGELPADLDWQGLADPSTSLVFYMSGRTAHLIAARLVAAGLPAATPAAIVAGATRDHEQRWLGTLSDLVEAIPTIDLSQPVLIGIGAAFAKARAANNRTSGLMVDRCRQATG
jgi:uroporphyrin-III C-methyltransferase/precorrin-2 dehydrogenase/sirohydrochlorin ferrochelatase